MSAMEYWLGIGVVCALVSMWLTRDRGRGTIVNLGLGVVGALVGGFAFNIVMAAPDKGYSIAAMVASAAASAIILAAYHAIAGRRPI